MTTFQLQDRTQPYGLSSNIFNPVELSILRRASELLDRTLHRQSLKDPDAARDYLRCKLAGLDFEVFGVLWLDAQHQLIADEVLSECLELAMLQQEFAAASPGDVVFTSDDEDLREQFEVTPCERAASEGWGLFDWDGTGLLQIQRVDEDATFSSDDEAVEFVRQRAQAGSALHLDALRVHDQHAPEIETRRQAGGTP